MAPHSANHTDTQIQGLKLVFMVAALSSTACDSSTSPTTDSTIRIPMRDGIQLATDLYFPEDSAPYSTILIRTPYNKDWLDGYGSYYARAGYLVAIQDVRGRWASEGSWEPFIHEGEDGFDTVEWLGTREWSTGRVGMMGGSYAGTAQFAAAVQKPPHLVTIVPSVAPAMPFDNIPRNGGALAMGWALRWTNIVENARTGQELQSLLRQSIAEDWSEPLSGLPVVELDRAVVGREIPYFRDWVRRAPDEAYWKPYSYLSELETVDLPVFLQSGWFDPGTRGAYLAFEHLVRGGNRHVRLVLGPWAHGDRGTRYLNGQDMGVAAERDLMAEYRKWFDFWLKTDALDAPNAPGVELYVMGSNRWINGDRYPLEGTTYRSLYLGGSPDSGGYGRLEWDRPAGTTAFDTFTYDPGTPTPSFHAALKRGSLDQYRIRIETGSDVLVYESEPVDQPFDIVGPIEVRLFASSSATDTDWTATLYGLSDTGDIRVIGFTFGILRARFRESQTVPTLLEPGTIYPFVVDLGHTAVTVRTGERLRLEIASAAFPEFSRNLNTGGHNELDSLWIQARQRIYRDSARASHILLPVIEFE